VQIIPGIKLEKCPCCGSANIIRINGITYNNNHKSLEGYILKKIFNCRKCKERMGLFLKDAEDGYKKVTKVLWLEDVQCNDEYHEIFKKLEEEINELKEAIKCKSDSDIKNEFGDIYFTLLNLSNFLKINPESALQKTNMKFLDRFSIVEEHAGDNIKKQTPKDFQRLWQIAKRKLKRKNS